MKNQLKAIIRDIQSGENVEDYVLIIVAVILAVLDIAGIVSDSIIAAAILAVLSLIVYGQIKLDRSIRAVRHESEMEGIKAFYSDRNGLPSLEDRVKASHKEIAILGLQLGDISHSYLSLLRQQASRGSDIRLLMMSPVDENGKDLPWVDELGKVHTFTGLHDLLVSNIKHLSTWLSEVPKEYQSKIEIKLYTTIPTASILLIDKDEDSGTIKVEPIIYRFSPYERPSFLVDRISSRVLYNKLVDSFNNLWSSSLDLSRVRMHLNDEES